MCVDLPIMPAHLRALIFRRVSAQISCARIFLARGVVFTADAPVRIVHALCVRDSGGRLRE
jgi:hypothetical protein